MKRILQILLIALLLFSFSTTCLAANDTNETSDIQPPSTRMTYIMSYRCNIDISGTGLATCTANMLAYPNTDKVKISMYLQKYDGGWSSLYHWTAEDGTSVTLSRDRYVASGYNYRVLVYFYAYEGTQTDSTSDTNSEYY